MRERSEAGRGSEKCTYWCGGIKPNKVHDLLDSFVPSVAALRRV